MALGQRLVAGIDVSATRGLDGAVVTEDGKLVHTVWFPNLAGLEVWLDVWANALVTIAVDAPGNVATCVGGRSAERRLHKMGISLYPTPMSADAAADWMRTGWAIFSLLRKMGFPESRFSMSDSPGDRHAIECYPYASYVAWSGKKRPPSKKPAIWARKILAVRGYKLVGTGKDAPDAVAAALTALAWLHHEAVPYGDPSDGIIWTPCALPPFATADPATPGSA